MVDSLEPTWSWPGMLCTKRGEYFANAMEIVKIGWESTQLQPTKTSTKRCEKNNYLEFFSLILLSYTCVWWASEMIVNIGDVLSCIHTYLFILEKSALLSATQMFSKHTHVFLDFFSSFIWCELVFYLSHPCFLLYWFSCALSWHHTCFLFQTWIVFLIKIFKKWRHA